MCVYISESLEEAEGMRQDGHGADAGPGCLIDFHKQVLSEELFIFYVSKKEWCIHNIPCHLHFTLVK